MEETIKALDTHCMHRVSILGGKREATNTGCRGRFVMGQLGRPQETQCDLTLPNAGSRRGLLGECFLRPEG